MKNLNATGLRKCISVLLFLFSTGLFAQPVFTVSNLSNASAGQGSKFQQLIQVRLKTTSRDILSSLSFRLIGRDNIKSARLYIGSTFYPWTYLYGTEITSITNDTITFTGNGNETYDLINDTYFNLVVELNTTATVGQTLDAVCLNAVINNSWTWVPANGNPNGSRPIVAAMSGTYTIKGTDGPNNFTKLSAAIDTLNRWGCLGGVTFLLQDDSVFSENFSARQIIQTGSATNQIIFKRSGTGSAKPIVRPLGTTSGDDAGFTLWSSDYVTFDGIVIDGPTVAGNKVDYGIRLRNACDDGCQNITIKNCTIQLDSLMDTYCIFTNRNVVLTSTDGNYNKLQILNNVIKQARWGIRLDNGNFSPYQEDSIIIAGNILSNFAISGGNSAIYARDVKNLVIRNNEIKDVRLGLTLNDWYRGMDVAAQNLKIYSNKIHGITNPGNTTGSRVIGIIAYGQNNYVYNNMLWDLNVTASTAVTAGNEVIRGINMQSYNNIGYCYVYNNTVFLNSPTNPAINQYASALRVENNITTCEIKNNILVSLCTGAAAMKNIALFYDVDHSRTMSMSSDNNIYYAGTPSAANLIGRINGTDRQTLLAYKQNNYGRDLNAISENVPFISASDLHIQTGTATWVESGGKPIPLVTTDIDGNVRNATKPDIGADEGAFLLSTKDSVAPLINYTPLISTSSTTNPTLTVTITDNLDKVDTTTFKPRLWYKKSNNSNTWLPAGQNTSTYDGWKWVNPTNNSSPFSFTIDYSLLYGGIPVPGQTIQYFVAAQDYHVNPNLSVYPVSGGYTATNVTNFSTTPSTYYSYKILKTLSGDYLVGSAQAAPFNTLNAAFARLDSSEITGSVRFLLTDAVYNLTNAIQINPINGATPTKTFTLKPNTGVTAKIVGYHTSNDAVFRLIGADYVIIDGSNTNGGTTRDLIIEDTAGYVAGKNGAIINVRSLGTGLGSKCITIKNCILRGGQNRPFLSEVMGILSGGQPYNSGDDNDSLIIDNNLIYNLRYGLRITGNQTGIHDYIRVTNNTLDSLTRHGMEFQRINDLIVDNNIIKNLNSGAANATYGAIWLQTNVTNATVSRNQIYNMVNTTANNQSLRGIDVNIGNTNANITIVNNMLGNIVGQSTYAIYIANTGNFSVLYNSVNLFGDLSTYQPAGYNTEHTCIRLTSATYDGKILNNIFNNHIITAQPTARTYKTYAIYFEHTNMPQNIKCDYNALWAGNRITTTKGYFGRFWNNDRTNINDWRTQSGMDMHSVNDSVKFVSATDLHIDVLQPAVVEGTGFSTTVTIDIDNQARNATTPDIGADEGTFIFFNNPPTDITLSKPRINEITPANTFLLKLATADLDIAQGDKHKTVLVNGTGNTDNALFVLKNDSLFVGAAALPAYAAKDTLLIRVRTTDLSGNKFEKALVILVNSMPTNISMGVYINSGVVKGSLASNLAASDPTDSTDFTYTLAAGAGDTNNVSFHITGSQLFVDSSFVFPTTKKVYVRIRVTDKEGLSFEKPFTIIINDPPSDIALSGTKTINENAPALTLIGTFTATDPNGDILAYILPSGLQDNAQFAISGGNKLASNAVFDYETKRTYNVTVRGTDPGGLSIDRSFTITIKNLSEAASNIILSDSSVMENLPASTVIGHFSCIDQDSGDVNTYSLFVGPGSTDNSSFMLLDDTLYTNLVFDYEIKKTCSIRVRSTDLGGKTFDKIFIIAVENDTSDDPIIGITDSKVIADVYPVPTGGILHINLKNAGSTPSIIINDMNGKQLLNRKATDENITLNLSSWAKGIYILQIINDKIIYSTTITIE